MSDLSIAQKHVLLAYLRLDIFDDYTFGALPNLPPNHLYESICLYSENDRHGTYRSSPQQ